MGPARRARLRGVHAGALALALGLSLAALGAPSSAQPPPAKTSPPPSATAQPSAPSTATAPDVPLLDPPKAADPEKAKLERQERAVALHDEAKALYDRGLYRRAIAKLEAAIELDPEGKELVYNLALIHEKLAEADIAETYYRRYIEMESDPKARERAAAIVKRLQGAKKALEHDIQERAAASRTSARAAATAAPTAPPARGLPAPSPVVLVLGGVAIASLGIGIGFGASALSTHPRDARTGPDTTAYELETRARTAHAHAVVADLSFVTSLVVGATATVLYFIEARTPRGAQPPSTGRRAASTPAVSGAPVTALRPRIAAKAPF